MLVQMFVFTFCEFVPLRDYIPVYLDALRLSQITSLLNLWREPKQADITPTLILNIEPST